MKSIIILSTICALALVQNTVLAGAPSPPCSEINAITSLTPAFVRDGDKKNLRITVVIPNTDITPACFADRMEWVDTIQDPAEGDRYSCLLTETNFSENQQHTVELLYLRGQKCIVDLNQPFDYSANRREPPPDGVRGNDDQRGNIPLGDLPSSRRRGSRERQRLIDEAKQGFNCGENAISDGEKCICKMGYGRDVDDKCVWTGTYIDENGNRMNLDGTPDMSGWSSGEKGCQLITGSDINPTLYLILALSLAPLVIRRRHI